MRRVRRRTPANASRIHTCACGPDAPRRTAAPASGRPGRSSPLSAPGRPSCPSARARKPAAPPSPADATCRANQRATKPGILRAHLGGHEIEVHLVRVGADQQIDILARPARQGLSGFSGSTSSPYTGMKRLMPKTGSKPGCIAQVDAADRLARPSPSPSTTCRNRRLRNPARGRGPSGSWRAADEPLGNSGRADHRSRDRFRRWRAGTGPWPTATSSKFGDRHRPGQFAEHGDVVRITAE